jgi:Putative zinc finger in N-recognin (UBR box)
MERQVDLEELLANANNQLTEEQRNNLIRLLQMQLGDRLPDDSDSGKQSPEPESFIAPFDFQYVGKDDLEVALVKYLEYNENAVRENSQKVASLMLTTAFGRKDFSEYLKDIYTGKTVKTGICRKLLKTKVDVGYQCLDCQKDPTCIICAGCFEKSNHKGHRIFLKQHVSGMCDCGDIDAWEIKGNCSDHTGYVEEDGYLPETQKAALINSIKKTLYFVVQGLEYYRDAGSKSSLHIGKLLDDIFDLLMELCGVYPSLTPVVSRAIYSPLEVDGKTVKLYHDPTRMDGFIDILEKPLDCKTSILGLLFRYGLMLNPETSKKLNSFVISLFADYEYKKILAIEYINYFAFYFQQEKIKLGEKTKVSNIIELAIQILTSEDLALMAIKQSNFELFLQTIIHITKSYMKDGHFNTTFRFWRYSVYSTLDYCLMKRQGIIYFFSKPKLVKLYFTILQIFENNRISFSLRPTDLNAINSITEEEYNTIEALTDNQIEMCGVLSTVKDSTRKVLLTNILIVLKDLIFEMRDPELDDIIPSSDKKEFKKRYFNAMLERSFSIYLATFCYYDLGNDGKIQIVDFKSEKYSEILKDVFVDGNEREKFWIKLGSSLARVSGFFREITRKCWVGYILMQDKLFYTTR